MCGIRCSTSFKRSFLKIRYFIKKVVMISKEKLKEQIDRFPENEISIDELIDRLIFIEKLEQRISSSERGEQTFSEEDMNREISKWSK